MFENKNVERDGINIEKSYEHSHKKVCSDFEMALNYHYLVVINNEVMIPRSLSELPNQEDISVGNILTNEVYEKKDFMLNFAVRFCPFCSQDIRSEEIKKMEEEDEFY